MVVSFRCTSLQHPKQKKRTLSDSRVCPVVSLEPFLGHSKTRHKQGPGDAPKSSASTHQRRQRQTIPPRKEASVSGYRNRSDQNNPRFAFSLENVAVGQNQWCHFGVGAPILVYSSGWIESDVHWGLTDLDFEKPMAMSELGV